MNSPNRLKNVMTGKLAVLAAIVLFVIPTAQSQQVEKLELVLSSPTVNTDKHDGYQFELRGLLLPKNTPFACGLVQDANRLGRYLLKVRYNKSDGLIATWVINLNDGRVIVWDAFIKYEVPEDSKDPLSFSYDAVILRSDQKALTDYTPASPDCFGGKLVIYFLNGA